MAPLPPYIFLLMFLVENFTQGTWLQGTVSGLHEITEPPVPPPDLYTAMMVTAYLQRLLETLNLTEASRYGEIPWTMRAMCNPYTDPPYYNFIIVNGSIDDGVNLSWYGDPTYWQTYGNPYVGNLTFNNWDPEGPFYSEALDPYDNSTICLMFLQGFGPLKDDPNWANKSYCIWNRYAAPWSDPTAADQMMFRLMLIASLWKKYEESKVELPSNIINVTVAADNLSRLTYKTEGVEGDWNLTAALEAPEAIAPSGNVRYINLSYNMVGKDGGGWLALKFTTNNSIDLLGTPTMTSVTPILRAGELTEIGFIPFDETSFPPKESETPISLPNSKDLFSGIPNHEAWITELLFSFEWDGWGTLIINRTIPETFTGSRAELLLDYLTINTYSTEYRPDNWDDYSKWESQILPEWYKFSYQPDFTYYAEHAPWFGLPSNWTYVGELYKATAELVQRGWKLDVFAEDGTGSSYRNMIADPSFEAALDQTRWEEFVKEMGWWDSHFIKEYGWILNTTDDWELHNINWTEESHYPEFLCSEYVYDVSREYFGMIESYNVSILDFSCARKGIGGKSWARAVEINTDIYPYMDFSLLPIDASSETDAVVSIIGHAISDQEFILFQGRPTYDQTEFLINVRSVTGGATLDKITIKVECDNHERCDTPAVGIWSDTNYSSPIASEAQIAAGSQYLYQKLQNTSIDFELTKLYGSWVGNTSNYIINWTSSHPNSILILPFGAMPYELFNDPLNITLENPVLEYISGGGNIVWMGTPEFSYLSFPGNWTYIGHQGEVEIWGTNVSAPFLFPETFNGSLATPTYLGNKFHLDSSFTSYGGLVFEYFPEGNYHEIYGESILFNMTGTNETLTLADPVLLEMYGGRVLLYHATNDVSAYSEPSLDALVEYIAQTNRLWPKTRLELNRLNFYGIRNWNDLSVLNYPLGDLPLSPFLFYVSLDPHMQTIGDLMHAAYSYYINGPDLDWNITNLLIEFETFYIATWGTFTANLIGVPEITETLQDGTTNEIIPDLSTFNQKDGIYFLNWSGTDLRTLESIYTFNLTKYFPNRLDLWMFHDTMLSNPNGLTNKSGIHFFDHGRNQWVRVGELEVKQGLGWDMLSLKVPENHEQEFYPFSDGERYWKNTGTNTREVKIKIILDIENGTTIQSFWDCMFLTYYTRNLSIIIHNGTFRYIWNGTMLFPELTSYMEGELFELHTLADGAPSTDLTINFDPATRIHPAQWGGHDAQYPQTKPWQSSFYPAFSETYGNFSVWVKSRFNDEFITYEPERIEHLLVGMECPVVADFNNDSKLDLIIDYENYADKLDPCGSGLIFFNDIQGDQLGIEAFLNRYEFNDTWPDVFPREPEQLYFFICSTEACDWNLDGRVDLFLGERPGYGNKPWYEGWLYYLSNEGTDPTNPNYPNFSAARIMFPDTAVHAYPHITSGYFNNDIYPDIIVTDLRYISIWFGRPDGLVNESFGKYIIAPNDVGDPHYTYWSEDHPYWYQDCDAADFNEDGNLDFIVIAYEMDEDYNQVSQHIFLFLGDGLGNFADPIDLNLTSGENIWYGSVTHADLNFDGALELIFGEHNPDVYSQSSIYYYEGHGDGTFGVKYELSIPYQGGDHLSLIHI